MRTILCTTGTSIAQGVAFHDPKTDADGETYRAAVRRRLETLRGELSGGDGFLRRASAESNSLRGMTATADDRVVLLHTETPDGRICAEEVRDLLRREMDVKAELAEVAGLQINDVNRFRRVGVQNLFAELDRRCRPLQGLAGEEVVLNATGGFKSTVPYLTLYGLLYRLPVVYLFERGSTLLTLPPAPIHFDYERLARAADALHQLSVQGVMPRDKFFAAIPGLEYHDREGFESLLEEDGTGSVTLSAFGMMLVQARSDEDTQAEVYLSPSAGRTYAASDGHVHDQFSFMLERVRDPLWRHAKIHPINASNLSVYKPGNTAERIACILQGRRVYVCELVDQHAYRLLEGRNRADYDLKSFSRWSLPHDKPLPPTTEEEAFRRQGEALERARRELQEVEEAWQKSELSAEADVEALRREHTLQMETLRNDHAAISRKLAESHAQCEAQERQFGDKLRQAEEKHRNMAAEQEAELERCRAALAESRRPWWKRWQTGRKPHSI